MTIETAPEILKTETTGEDAKVQVDDTPAVAAAPESPVSKKVIAARIDETLARVKAVKAAVANATVAKVESDVPGAVINELTAIQFLLKNLAGVSKASTLLVPQVDLENLGEVGAKVKKSTDAVLTEVENRLELLKADLGQSTMLDAVQATKLDSTADMITKVFPATESPMVILDCLSEEQRELVLPAIQKAMDGLSRTFVCLQTQSVSKDGLASPAQVADLLHDHVAGVEHALLKAIEPEALTKVMLADVREIEKSIGQDEAIKPIAVFVADVRKAATQYRVRCNYEKPEHAADRYAVQLVKAPEPPAIVAAFPTRIEAENEALRLNVSAVAGMAKRISVVVEENSEGEETAKADDVKGEETEVEKIGRPMKGDRLQRLQGVVKLLKEALHDLRGGSASMEKFKKVGDLLGTLINELNAPAVKACDPKHKGKGKPGMTDEEEMKGKKPASKSAMTARGLTDERGLTPDKPNVGSGIQPDTTTVADVTAVMGEGTPISAEVLKRLESLEKRLEDRELQLAKAQSENVRLRKSRTAPSVAPDADLRVEVEKKDEASPVGWPSDMNQWNPKNT